MLVEITKNGTKYAFPATVVAHNRASYYADKDHPHDPSKRAETYNEEHAHAMANPSEILDWAQNNMNPEDIGPENRRLLETGALPTFEDCWSADEDTGGGWNIVKDTNLG